MSRAVSIPLGVVLAQEKVEHSWQDYRWRAVSVFLDALPKSRWRELQRGNGYARCCATSFNLRLCCDEKMSYRVNLANGVPSLYIVLRDEQDPAAKLPVSVHLVSASPFAVQSYDELGGDSVERVAMPDRLIRIVEQFIEHQELDDDDAPLLKRSLSVGGLASPRD